MARMILWVVLGLLILGLILMIVTTVLWRKKKRPIDYFAFFVIGLTWLPIGLAMQNSALWIMGLVFLSIGLINQKKWKKNRRSWKKLSKNEKKIRIVLLVFLGFLVLLGILFFFLTEAGIFS
ncbi:hypothetical protein ACFLZB_03615 [Nanoarchaeota archaeon]